MCLAARGGARDVFQRRYFRGMRRTEQCVSFSDRDRLELSCVAFFLETNTLANLPIYRLCCLRAFVTIYLFVGVGVVVVVVPFFPFPVPLSLCLSVSLFAPSRLSSFPAAEYDTTHKQHHTTQKQALSTICDHVDEIEAVLRTELEQPNTIVDSTDAAGGEPFSKTRVGTFEEMDRVGRGSASGAAAGDNDGMDKDSQSPNGQLPRLPRPPRSVLDRDSMARKLSRVRGKEVHGLWPNETWPRLKGGRFNNVSVCVELLCVSGYLQF